MNRPAVDGLVCCYECSHKSPKLACEHGGSHFVSLSGYHRIRAVQPKSKLAGTKCFGMGTASSVGTLYPIVTHGARLPYTCVKGTFPQANGPIYSMLNRNGQRILSAILNNRVSPQLRSRWRVDVLLALIERRHPMKALIAASFASLLLAGAAAATAARPGTPAIPGATASGTASTPYTEVNRASEAPPIFIYHGAVPLTSSINPSRTNSVASWNVDLVHQTGGGR